CQHKLERGIEPEMRTVETDGGRRVDYVNAGFAPAYWGGYGVGPGLFTGFLLRQALAPHALLAGRYRGGRPRGGHLRRGRCGGSGGGDFGGGDFGGGDFGGGDF